MKHNLSNFAPNLFNIFCAKISKLKNLWQFHPEKVLSLTGLQIYNVVKAGYCPKFTIIVDSTFTL